MTLSLKPVQAVFSSQLLIMYAPLQYNTDPSNYRRLYIIYFIDENITIVLTT